MRKAPGATAGMHLSAAPAACAGVPCQKSRGSQETQILQMGARHRGSADGPSGSQGAQQPGPQDRRGAPCSSSPQRAGMVWVPPPVRLGSNACKLPRVPPPSSPDPRAWRRQGLREQGRKKPPVWERDSAPCLHRGSALVMRREFP